MGAIEVNRPPHNLLPRLYILNILSKVIVKAPKIFRAANGRDPIKFAELQSNRG